MPQSREGRPEGRPSLRDRAYFLRAAAVRRVHEFFQMVIQAGWFSGCMSLEGGNDGHSGTEFRVADQRDRIRCERDGGSDRRQSEERRDAVEYSVGRIAETGHGDLQSWNAFIEPVERHEFSDQPAGDHGAEDRFQLRHQRAGAHSRLVVGRGGNTHGGGQQPGHDLQRLSAPHRPRLRPTDRFHLDPGGFGHGEDGQRSDDFGE